MKEVTKEQRKEGTGGGERKRSGGRKIILAQNALWIHYPEL